MRLANDLRITSGKGSYFEGSNHYDLQTPIMQKRGCNRRPMPATCRNAQERAKTTAADHAQDQAAYCIRHLPNLQSANMTAAGRCGCDS